MITDAKGRYKIPKVQMPKETNPKCRCQKRPCMMTDAKGTMRNLVMYRCRRLCVYSCSQDDYLDNSIKPIPIVFFTGNVSVALRTRLTLDSASTEVAADVLLLLLPFEWGGALTL